jgi:hypothetical protein
MAQAQRFRLAHVEAIHMRRLDRTYDLQQGSLMLGFQFRFQFVRLVEVIFDGALAAARDEDHLGDPGGHGFFHGVLDQRLVHDR